MKRFIAALTVTLTLTAQPAYAGYEEALQLVREAKYGMAMAEFLPLARDGHAPSQFSVGLMYHLGRGVQPDLAIAYDWYKKAAMQENGAAMNNIGMMYLNGEYVARHRDVAFKLFEKAAETHAQAKDNLAQCYENGWGVKQDIPMAIDYYQRAGDQGYIAGYFHIGELYEKNHPGHPKDIEKAVEWYIKAAEKSFTRARSKLIELRRLPDSMR